MLIVDLNQVLVSTLLVQLGSHSNTKIEVDLVRHMVLNCLRSYNTKFRDEYGEMILACDDKNYWRRDLYPYYKINRKKAREQTDHDWPAIFDALNKIRDELKQFFPYRVIQVDKAEADDVIASLCSEFGCAFGGEPILIVSGDKDFAQLQKYGNVKQYDPIRKKWITALNPAENLKLHILKGDVGDGVPNVLTEDAALANGDRQKPLRERKITELMQIDPSTYEGTLLRNYKRNQQLIDLDFVPQNIRDGALEQYRAQEGKGRGHLYNYMLEYRLKQHLQNIQDF